MTITAFAVEFTHVAGLCPIEEANEYYQRAQRDRVVLGDIKRIHFRREDGTESSSYGKAWYWWNTETKVWEIQRIGAGAYGDMVVWRNPNLPNC